MSVIVCKEVLSEIKKMYGKPIDNYYNNFIEDMFNLISYVNLPDSKSLYDVTWNDNNLRIWIYYDVFGNHDIIMYYNGGNDYNNVADELEYLIKKYPLHGEIVIYEKAIGNDIITSLNKNNMIRFRFKICKMYNLMYY